MESHLTIQHSDAWDQVRAAFAASLKDVGYLRKDKEADAVKFTYKYVDLTDVLAEVKRVCGLHGLSVSQLHTAAEDKLSIAIWLLHESGEWMILPPTMLRSPADAQALGSATTYLRRHSLLTVFSIPAGDDDGAEATRTARNQQQYDGNRSAQELAIRSLMAEYPDRRSDFAAAFKARFGKALTDLNVNKHNEALVWTAEWFALDPGVTDPAPEDDVSPGAEGSDHR